MGSWAGTEINQIQVTSGVHMTLDNNNEVTYYDIIDKILHRVSKD